MKVEIPEKRGVTEESTGAYCGSVTGLAFLRTKGFHLSDTPIRYLDRDTKGLACLAEFRRGRRVSGSISIVHPPYPDRERAKIPRQSSLLQSGARAPWRPPRQAVTPAPELPNSMNSSVSRVSATRFALTGSEVSSVALQTPKHCNEVRGHFELHE